MTNASGRFVLAGRSGGTIRSWRSERAARIFASRSADVATLVPNRGWFQKRDLAKWAALPCFIFWLTIMIFIWLFLVG
jgi:hypothetical protein